jgi:hypothetical protein
LFIPHIFLLVLMAGDGAPRRRYLQDLKEKHGLREGNLSLPREIVLLNGAPGSGKGANSPFIVSTMGASRVVRPPPS